MKQAFEVIYQDEYLVIVNKSTGVPVIPSRTSEISKSLKHMLIERFGQIFVVHRIDADTSGLVLMAKDADTHRMLNTMFQNRKIEKSYLILTRGIPSPSSGQISLSLKKLNNQNKSVVSREGKSALSTYSVSESFGNIALCEAQIQTGRHHQLRVHFKAINTPLLVDPIYGDEGFYLSEIKAKKYKKSKNEEERPLLGRLSLHARELKFQHPRIDKEIQIKADLPKDLRATINQLRKAF